MFAVVGRGLFYKVSSKRFGTLGRALFTLFQLITLDDWFYVYSEVVTEDSCNKSSLLSLIHLYPILKAGSYIEAGGELLAKIC